METVVEGNGEGKRFVAMAPSNVAVSWRCRVSHVDRRLGDIGRKEGAEAVRGLGCRLTLGASPCLRF